MQRQPLLILPLLLAALFLFAGCIAPLAYPVECGGQLIWGESVTGTISRPGQACIYEFTSGETSLLSIQVTGDGEFEPLVEVSAGGKVLVSSFAPMPGEPVTIADFPVPFYARYTVTVRGWNDETQGAFTVSVAPPALPEFACEGELPRGTVAMGHLVGTADVCVLDVAATEGETLQVQVAWAEVPPARIYGELTVPDANNELVTVSKQGGLPASTDANLFPAFGATTPFVQQVSLPVTTTAEGLYTLLLMAADGQRSGLFYVRVAPEGETGGPRAPSTCGGSIEPGMVLEDEVPRPEEACVYTLSSAGDQLLDVFVRSGAEEFDPVVALVDERGAVLAEDDDGGAETGAGPADSLLQAISVPADGVYSLYVFGRHFESAGLFTLEVQPAP